MDLWLVVFMTLGVVSGYILTKNNIINIMDKMERVLISITILLVFSVGYSAGSFASSLESSIITDLVFSTLSLLILSILFSILLTGIFEFLLRRAVRR